MKNAHRIQALAVLLLGVAGWIVVDLGAVKDGVRAFIDTIVDTPPAGSGETYRRERARIS